jgi:hypothetical protein
VSRRGRLLTISTEWQEPTRSDIYLDALLATRSVARCGGLCWVGIVARVVLLLTGTKPPPPSRQASQNNRCLAQVQVSVGCARRQQPPPVASECVWVPTKRKVSALCDRNGRHSSGHSTLSRVGMQRNEIQHREKDITHLSAPLLLSVVLANVLKFDTSRTR